MGASGAAVAFIAHKTYARELTKLLCKFILCQYENCKFWFYPTMLFLSYHAFVSFYPIAFSPLSSFRVFKNPLLPRGAAALPAALRIFKPY